MIRSVGIGVLAASALLAAGSASALERVLVFGGQLVPLTAPFNATVADYARIGDRQRVLELIAEGVDVNVPEVSGNGTTALHWAAYLGDAELVAALLAAGAKPGVWNMFSSTPMMEAATIGHTEIIRLLLAAGADVESANYENQTALMAVARTGNVAAARLLLEAGANPNARETWSGQTPIMWAAGRRHPDMIRLLAQYGADPNARSTDRVWEPKQLADSSRPLDIHYGGVSAPFLAAREGCPECIFVLAEVGANLNLINRNGTTPLLVAIWNRRWDSAAALVQAGANPSQFDIFGRSPVYSTIDMDGLLSSQRPDPDSPDRTTPMQLLAMMLEAGADPEIALRQRQPYRQVPFDRQDRDNSGANVTPLELATLGGRNAEAAALLIEYGADPYALTGNAALVMGVSTRTCGSGCSRNRAKGAGTPEDAIAMVDALLEVGVDIHQTNPNGQTALHAAVSRANGNSATQLSFRALVEHLMRKGASWEIAATNGSTPLSMASNAGLQEFMQGIIAEISAANTAAAVQAPVDGDVPGAMVLALQ